MGLIFGSCSSCAGDGFHVIKDSSAFSDFTMVKVMLPAVVVGGLGVLALTRMGEAHYYVKDANLLAVLLGAAIFGIALVFLGYCPEPGSPPPPREVCMPSSASSA